MYKYSGTSLVEVMICLFMMATCMLGMAGLRLNQERVLQQQRQYSAAWALMNYKFNELRYFTGTAEAFQTGSNNIGNNNTGNNNTGNNNIEEDIAADVIRYEEYNFTFIWKNITLISKDQNLQIKQVSLQISWQDTAQIVQTINSTIVLGTDAFVY